MKSIKRGNLSVFDSKPHPIKLKSNATKLAGSNAKLFLVCPICSIDFERYYSQAKNSVVNYCSPECSHEGQKIPIKTECEVCKRMFFVNPSLRVKIRTCGSPECVSNRRSELAYAGVIGNKGMPSKHRRAVISLNVETGEERRYESIRHAASAGIQQASITRACQGLQKTAGGMKWKYA